jgi:transcriptional regulator with XRE-family HTH domain
LSIRIKRQFSQADFVEKAHISITFLSNIERGNNFLQAGTLCNIAEALDVQVWEIFKVVFMYNFAYIKAPCLLNGYLFVSYAYGTPHKDSDLDLYVVLKDGLPMRDLCTAYETVSKLPFLSIPPNQCRYSVPYFA